jgi:ABC-type multidrug transport system fused ATPase/permease subunit
MILYFTNTILISIMFILSCFSEQNFTETNTGIKSPEHTSSLLSQLTFWWINSLINAGFKKELKREDLYEVDYREGAEFVSKKLENDWNTKALLYINQVRRTEETFSSPLDCQVEYKLNNNKEDENIRLNNTNDGEEKVKIIKKIPQPSIGLSLFRIFSIKFFGIVSIKVGHDFLNFARPILLDKLITFVKDKEQNLSVGLFFIFLLCLTSLSQTLIIQHYYHFLMLMGHQIKISLMNIIYKKSMVLSTSAKKTTTLGEMTNLITNDAGQFEFGIYQLVGIISTPLQLVISTYMLYKYLGIASFVGIASILLFLPTNAFIVKRSKNIRKEKYKIQDSRIKIMNELLNGIRIIKFYGWELAFQNLVNQARKKEINLLIRSELLNTVSGFTWQIAPFVVAAVSFAAYLLIDEKNVLDPNIIFVSLTLFSMLRFPLNSLPYLFQRLILV